MPYQDSLAHVKALAMLDGGHRVGVPQIRIQSPKSKLCTLYVFWSITTQQMIHDKDATARMTVTNKANHIPTTDLNNCKWALCKSLAVHLTLGMSGTTSPPQKRGSFAIIPFPILENLFLTISLITMLQISTSLLALSLCLTSCLYGLASSS